MSTRTNVVVSFGSTRIFIYRHHDGYLAETGADLVKQISAAAGDASRLVESLLAERYEQASYESEPRRIYELTTDVHGDIEYLYAIRYDDRAVRISYATRKPGDPDLDDVWATGSLDGFIEAVNADIRATNVRIAQLRESSPGVYGNCEDLEEVAS